MTRGGRIKDRDEPERRCIATGETQPRGGLIRFVVGPDSQIVPDIEGKLPGRGLYVSADRAAIAQAGKRKLFARAARAPVTVPDGLDDLVHDLLTRRVIELIALGRKAGQAVAGYEKVRDWLTTETAEVLIQASDGSERGKTKLRPPAEGGSYIGCLTAEELGSAFGREHVIHAALAYGGLSSRVVEEAAKLARMRGTVGGADATGED
ncbi:RNA-binding protein [Pararhodobacter marinus]|uniref:RNA-binding protein n=1 Tax=Pararhodobacter marinus TaxID=2184063 RepID=A0A2U2CIY6_9RHOB|nr:RNA-binding protein [Pararhodobacter marinus]PWE31850.1 RNA-binding protein [Pararhodobacter marinus]